MIEGLIVDSFAGGGGASCGIEMALGRSPDIAINHNAEALAMHQANHPSTLHLSKNIWQVDPLEYVRGRKVALAWFSPDCKHFSKAKGGKPVARNIRDLAWVVVLWAKQVRPRVIMLENVEEFRTWGPLTAEDMPDPERKGETFKRWVGELKRLGYKVEWKELRACDFGAPTIRKRLFLIARCDGAPIVWPEATHGKGKLPYRTAAECIDWSIPAHSIFLSKEEGRKVGVNRPLAEATMARIAKGVKRYVIDAEEPFIVNLTHQGGDRNEGLDEPFKTVTGANRGEKAIVIPSIVGVGGRQGQSEPRPLTKPYQTITAKADSVVVQTEIAPFVVRTAHGDVDKNGKRRGKGQHTLEEPLPTVTSSQDFAVVAPLISYAQQGGASRSADEPLHTVTASAKDQNQLVEALIAPHVMTMRNAGKPHNGADEPTHTITAGGAHLNLVSAFLAQHNLGVVGHDAREPVSTITQTGSQQTVVAAHMLQMKGSARRDRPADEPLGTITAQGLHHAEVRAFLMKYYGNEEGGHGLDDPAGTVTTKDRFGLVMVQGLPYRIVDITMRMLAPRELFNAQGFPASYKIEVEFNGKVIGKTAQIRMCGNSVSPVMAKALVKANLGAASQAQDAA